MEWQSHIKFLQIFEKYKNIGPILRLLVYRYCLNFLIIFSKFLQCWWSQLRNGMKFKFLNPSRSTVVACISHSTSIRITSFFQNFIHFGLLTFSRRYSCISACGSEREWAWKSTEEWQTPNFVLHRDGVSYILYTHSSPQRHKFSATQH